MSKYLLLVLVVLFTATEVQAGWWDKWWPPGRRRRSPPPSRPPAPITCEYSPEERQRVTPIESEKAFERTPVSYPVEKFEIQSAMATRPWLRDFRYIIVINKAATGRTAQSIMVFEDGYPILQDRVSTGRETLELRRRHETCLKQPPNSYYSVTATGYYPIQQLIENHRSESFDADMPYSMFYDRSFGLALHQVNEAFLSRLGSRASGGCTRLRPGFAEELFFLVKKTKGAEIPVFKKDGSPVLLENGQIKRTKTISTSDGRSSAYSAIVIIQDIVE